MKYLLLPLFCIIFQLHVFSQKNYTFIREADLTGKQQAAWYSFDTTWKKHIFPGCLLENHLKLSCAHCDNIYIDVKLKIDSTGKLVSYEKTGGEMCGQEVTDKLVKCFLDFFYFLEFPPELRNVILEVKLGSSLKC